MCPHTFFLFGGISNSNIFCNRLWCFVTSFVVQMNTNSTVT
ncbi:hypothetical protein [Maribacter dokdonensis]